MKIEFAGNLQAVLYELRQQVTYEGLLNGLPTAERNQKRIQGLLASPENQVYGVPPYLVPPAEKALETPRGKPYPFGTPSALPGITCVARCEDFFPVKEGEGDGAGLVVIWFQPEFAMPMDPAVAEHLRGVDWKRHAGSFWY